MIIKEQLKELKPYQPGKPIDEVKKEFNLKKVVKLASNENPFGCSEHVKQAIMKRLNEMAIYPDGYAAQLRTKLAKHLGVGEKQLIFGNGSDEVVQIICRSYLKQGTNTVMATPTFPQYKHNAVIEGAEIREIPLINGEHDLQSMLNAIDEQTKIVWICNPNNPTGAYIEEERIQAFLDQVPKHVLVVLDEAYFEYVTKEDYPRSISYLNTYENVMILRTFSKAYGLAALRIGYGISHEKIIQEIEPAREPFNTNALAQLAASVALDDQAFIDYCRKENQKGLEQYYDFCEEYQLNYYPSQGNFILIDFKKDGQELFEALLKKGYIVRSGKALGFPTSLRITVGSKEQNEEIIEHLKQLI
ncbi:histidinol-phosphate transaminase [Bacillus sp. FJAT-47783]|uniref:histidinol-phosphate transaminase n=1 Tax=Bacillus sp. FJAT-47783 TaxID=2922712 RepID=UPI001FABD6FB|nr:histidinol-phosphate transaminase [Bacillus sp. FJAT-47783]